MEIDEKDITEAMYVAYGSDSGILFGIPAECKKAVETVVRLTIEKVLEIKGIKED